MSIIIGIDHGYYAIKTAHCSFPAGLTSYGEHEPYTRQGLLEFGGCFFVCGSGRQPIQRDKTVNDNYYLLTLAAIAKEILQRGLPPECSVRIAAGLPLTSFGRDKPKFKEYLLRSNQPVNFKFEGVEYSITIEEVAVFPQGYAALMTEVGLLQDEPSIKKEETNNVSNPIRTADEREQYRDLIRENIEYDILAKNNPADRIRLDELVELMLDTVCSKRSSIRIAGDEFPTEVVKSRFLKLEAQHIQYVLDSLKDNPPHIHNIKKYLLAALYNAPLTIENYYAAQINHDLYGRNRGDVNWK